MLADKSIRDGFGPSPGVACPLSAISLDSPRWARRARTHSQRATAPPETRAQCPEQARPIALEFDPHPVDRRGTRLPLVSVRPAGRSRKIHLRPTTAPDKHDI